MLLSQMKLLKKEEIGKHKAAERQREVDEGVKLAQRVDALREVAAQEEASLEKFRRETIATIHKEIEAATAERDTLKAEVKTLQTQREEAMIPVVEAWKKVKETALLHDKIQQELNDRHTGLKVKEGYADETLRDLSTRKERVRQEEARTHELLVEADQKRDAAAETEMKANDLLIKAIKTMEQTEAKGSELASFLEAREKAIALKEEELRKQEIDLAKEFSRLKDREATLERNLKRRG